MARAYNPPSDGGFWDEGMTSTRKAIAFTLFLCIGLSQASSAQPRSTMNALMMHWSSEDLPSSPAMDAASNTKNATEGQSFDNPSDALSDSAQPASSTPEITNTNHATVRTSRPLGRVWQIRPDSPSVLNGA